MHCLILALFQLNVWHYVTLMQFPVFFLTLACIHGLMAVSPYRPPYQKTALFVIGYLLYIACMDINSLAMVCWYLCCPFLGTPSWVRGIHFSARIAASLYYNSKWIYSLQMVSSIPQAGSFLACLYFPAFLPPVHDPSTGDLTSEAFHKCPSPMV